MRMPPGRAGRLRLVRRLATARRASDLLARKLRILRREQERLDLLVERTGDAWAEACATADLWAVRAGLLGGQRALRLATREGTAAVAVQWSATMGIRYPSAGALSTGDASPHLFGTAALYGSRDAHQRALEAAVKHATATAASRIVRAEVAGTRIRLRAIDDRSIPRLQQALVLLEASLDELEHADAARVRRAVPVDTALRRS
jgi:V/A-type H+-transporting ATPase subunit D